MDSHLLSSPTTTETGRPVPERNHFSSNHDPDTLELGTVRDNGQNIEDAISPAPPESRERMDVSAKKHGQEQDGHDTTPFPNTFFFMRPRLLQYYDHGSIVESSGHTVSTDIHDHLVNNASHDLKTQRDFLNLFVDLIWVGIVSNVSENFVSSAFEPGSSWGLAFLEFIVLFLAAFKIWHYMQKFLNTFFNKDYLQSLFITWILIVALYFGIEAPNFLEPGGSKTIIWTYLTAKYSFVAIEFFYSIFIPQIRRQIFIMLILSLPISGLWIGALRVDWPIQATLIIPALLLEGIIATIMELPVGDWFLKGAPKKALDPDNVIERFQGFFIIILGEGVFTLINGATAPRVSLAIMSLMIYYVLFLLYFNGDMTRSYIHAIFRNRYTSAAFSTIHVALYGSLLLLDGCIRYLLSLDAAEDTVLSSPDPSAIETWNNSLRKAKFTVSAGLTSVMICMTVKPLLNKSLDKTHSLRLGSRYLRLAPRLLVVIVAMCLPIKANITIKLFLGVFLAMLLPLVLWEYFISLEINRRLIEPNESDKVTA